MDKLTSIILGYESDTFSASASDLTREEALAMATHMFNWLCTVVEEGGRLSCDGVYLSDVLEDIRNPNGAYDEHIHPCPKCGQHIQGQTGEYPCPVCGLPTLWDQEMSV